MTNAADPPAGPGEAAPPPPPVSDAAFDQWLARGLHALYDEVAREPIPPALLALIEKHRDAARP